MGTLTPNLGTLRSCWTEYSCMDMTPLELARELGFSYLYDMLAPVVRNPIPSETLMRLQAQFHDIIRHDLGGRVDEERMYLPVLDALTEIGDEPVWFPVKFAPIATASLAFLKLCSSKNADCFGIGLCIPNGWTCPDRQGHKHQRRRHNRNLSHH